MVAIVAFTVKDKEMGEEALERLEGEAEDVALVYETDKGKVKIEQTSPAFRRSGRRPRGCSVRPSASSPAR